MTAQHFTIDPKQPAKRWRSRIEGYQTRRQVYVCRACGRWHHDTKPAVCACHSAVFTRFDSSAEARRYAELGLLAEAGRISHLVLQPAYPIIINGARVCVYKADFQYRRDGRLVVEDVKGGPGSESPVFRLKKKLVEASYGIEITITRGG